MASAPSETPTSIAPGGVPSRNALKKEAKKAEKAEKARIRAAAQAGSSAAAVDLASDNYGDLSPIRSSTDRTSERRVRFKNLPSDENTPVIFRARVHNARVQSTKLAFLVLRQQSETIQCVVAANEECTVSKQMVKWAGGISSESIVLVHGLVKKVSPPIKSATISDLEIHAQKVYVLSGVHVRLPIQVDDASRPEPSSVDSTQQNESLSDDSNRPFVSLKTKLDHRVISLRSPVNHAIFRIRSGLVALFREFLSKENFIEVSTPKLLATATEGGSDVFEVKYFGSKAYLAQSPQLYKQMLIAADMERVFEVAPVFRAENSNTHRHMTEVRNFRD
ncbi:MAG: aspartate--tRNA ligase dps1 [Geoglossum simile]|nr:MAG: aspartate--tRNA ligase dps1 [Geoglossum simile]